MFTGLIEEMGKILSVQRIGSGMRLRVHAPFVSEDLQIGDSISVNGVCQTAVLLNGEYFEVDTVEETLKKTNLGSFVIGTRVNLERALKANSRLGGHFVLGHADTIGTISRVKELSGSHALSITYPASFRNLVVPSGSIAIDGVSLTVAEIRGTECTVAIIPHTGIKTSLLTKRTGDSVNLEFDILGKYVIGNMNNGKRSGIHEDWLKEQGFA